MAFNKKTIKDVDLKNKKVLLRVDFNIPLTSSGDVANDYKIRKALPTIEYLFKNEVQSIGILSHLGRPEGKPDPRFSLRGPAERLGELLREQVEFVDDCLKRPGGSSRVAVFENVRFYQEEAANDAEFAAKLAAGYDIFVEDAFGVVHRDQASLTGVTNVLPGVAGLLVEKEISTITGVLDNPRQPFIAVLGGAKITDKIGLINHLIDKDVSRFLIAGAMANAFLAAGGLIPESDVFDQETLDQARQIESRLESLGKKIILPNIDLAVAKKPEATAGRREVLLSELEADDLILDIGQQSLELFIREIQDARTVIWNGTFGMNEIPAFAKSTEAFARALAGTAAKTIIGGGDTTGFIDRIGMLESFSYVSTGGGASLELMAGKALPAIEALQDK